MVHSAILTLVAFAISTAYCLDYSTSAETLIALTFAGVCFIGLPHGGLDYQLGTTWLSGLKKSDNRWKRKVPTIFLTSYLLIGGAVIIGWYTIPSLTVLLFFGLAAWHFGLEEEIAPTTLSLLDHAGIAARGGMVIWCTALFRPSEVSNILNEVLPTNLVAGSLLVSIVLTSVPILLFLIVWDFRRVARQNSTSTLTTYALRLISFAVMFGVCPVLISFAVYFCGWHSVRGLAHLKDQVGGDNQKLIRQLAPFSILAILLFLSGFLFYQSQLAASAAAIRTLFIGLSAVAIPHLVLHVAMDRWAMKRGQRLDLSHPRIPEAAVC